MKRIDFNIYKAIEIYKGNVQGKIVTRDGRCFFPTVMTTKKSKNISIVGVVERTNQTFSYNIDGTYVDRYHDEYDLFIEICDSKNFNVGDRVVCIDKKSANSGCHGILTSVYDDNVEVQYDGSKDVIAICHKCDLTYEEFNHYDIVKMKSKVDRHEQIGMYISSTIASTRKEYYFLAIMDTTSKSVCNNMGTYVDCYEYSIASNKDKDEFLRVLEKCNPDLYNRYMINVNCKVGDGDIMYCNSSNGPAYLGIYKKDAHLQENTISSFHVLYSLSTKMIYYNCTCNLYNVRKATKEEKNILKTAVESDNISISDENMDKWFGCDDKLDPNKRCCTNCLMAHVKDKNHIACWHNNMYSWSDEAYNSDNPNDDLCDNFISKDTKKCIVCKYFDKNTNQCRHKDNTKIEDIDNIIVVKRMMTKPQGICEKFKISKEYEKSV